MKKLYIVGAGGFGREVIWLARRINEEEIAKGNLPPWKVTGFIDDNVSLYRRWEDGYPVLGDCTYLGSLKEDVYVVIAIGAAKVKKKVAEKLFHYPNVHFANLIDPSVIMSDRIQMGEGCIICAGTILTVDITIGNHVSLNPDCTLGHDSVIEDYVTVYPGVNIAGNVMVKEASELGTGAQIIQGRTVGRQSVVGAGAVVIRDIAENCTVVGIPATSVCKKQKEEK